MHSSSELRIHPRSAMHVLDLINSVPVQDGNCCMISHEDFNLLLQYISEQKKGQDLIDWFMTAFVDNVQNVIKPKFWTPFISSCENAYFKFPAVIDELYKQIQGYSVIIKELEKVQEEDTKQNQNILTCAKVSQPKALRKTFLEVFRSVLLSEWPVDFRSVVMEYYSMTFRAFQATRKGSVYANFDSTVICAGCENQLGFCCCQIYLEEFASVNTKLFKLQLLENILGDVPINVAQNYTEKFIKETCNGSFEVSYLVLLRNWLHDTVLKWLAEVYLEDNDANSFYSASFKKLLVGYKDRLLHALYESYAEVRLEQMFDVIIDYPDSQAALEDLRECINIAGLRPKLITSLRTTMETRLLHPGVNTSDILTAYISAINALRVLDSSGVVLQLVCDPICKYLRTREDTVRCIVFSLTDDSCEELTNELMKGRPLVLEDSYASDEEVEYWESWTPDPVDADPSKTTKSQRSSDIISMLVGIYGSKEMFVNEYRTLLADRLLNTFSCNFEREIRNFELLRVRFGESQLHYCEVMLKDVANSKRINTHLNSGEVADYTNEDFQVNAMILSAQFWPPFKEEKIELPEYIWQHLTKYTAAFETLKGNRTLSWKPHLGLVELSIEFKERTIDFLVSPVHATILWHFQEKSQWAIEELADVMKTQTSLLRRKITFWQNNGILKEEETDVFVLVEEQKASNQESMVMVEDETESVTASSQDQREEELQTFWSFIVGMLTNMESLPLERIHSMLRMFAMQGPNTNEFTMQGMKQFLDKKVRERKLLYSSGLYKLPRFES